MALIISETILAQSRDLLRQDDVAGAWGVLAAAGDSYAAKAQLIVSEWQDPQSVFAMMVDVQWDRTVGKEVQQAEFMAVATTHLGNYLDYIQGDPDNRLPKTDFIEASYRDALAQSGLLPTVAIDSIFSAADLRLENDGLAPVSDLSWGTMLGMEPERIVYDSTVFQDLPGSFAGLGGEMVEIGQRVIAKFGTEAVEQVQQAYDALLAAGGEAGSQIANTDVEALGRAYQLLAALEPTIPHARSALIVGAAWGRPVGGASTGIDEGALARVTRGVHQALLGSEIGPFESREALIAAAADLTALIEADPSLRFAVIDFSQLDGAELERIAARDDVSGRAVRHALVNFNAFALLSTDGLSVAPGAAGAAYDRENFTTEYLSDRAHAVAQLLDRNEVDSVTVANGRFHDQVYLDVATGVEASTVDVAHIGPGLPPDAVHYVFGDANRNDIEGGNRGDRLYGGGGADVLTGGRGEDYLEGGSGNDELHAGDEADTLVGGEGVDHLHGGAGIDTYHAGLNDLISDSDGAGQVVLDGEILRGGVADENGVTRSEDGRHMRRLCLGVVAMLLLVAAPLAAADYALVKGEQYPLCHEFKAYLERHTAEAVVCGLKPDPQFETFRLPPWEPAPLYLGVRVIMQQNAFHIRDGELKSWKRELAKLEASAPHLDVRQGRFDINHDGKADHVVGYRYAERCKQDRNGMFLSNVLDEDGNLHRDFFLGSGRADTLFGEPFLYQGRIFTFQPWGNGAFEIYEPRVSPMTGKGMFNYGPVCRIEKKN